MLVFRVSHSFLFFCLVFLTLCIPLVHSCAFLPFNTFSFLPKNSKIEMSNIVHVSVIFSLLVG